MTPPQMYDVIPNLYIWTLTIGVSLLKFRLKILYLDIWLLAVHLKEKENKMREKRTQL